MQYFLFRAFPWGLKSSISCARLPWTGHSLVRRPVVDDLDCFSHVEPPGKAQVDLSLEPRKPGTLQPATFIHVTGGHSIPTWQGSGKAREEIYGDILIVTQTGSWGDPGEEATSQTPE